MIIPETYSNQDWPRKVAQGYRAIAARTRALEGTAASAQGAVWHNFAITPTIAANTWTTLDFTSPNTLRNAGNQQTYLNNGYIRGDDNEWFQLRIDITFTADDATASFLRFGLTDDTPGGFGTFIKPLHPVLLGAGVEDEATYSFPTFSEYDLNANGWLPQVFTDGPVTISQAQMFVTREVV